MLSLPTLPERVPPVNMPDASLAESLSTATATKENSSAHSSGSRDNGSTRTDKDETKQEKSRGKVEHRFRQSTLAESGNRSVNSWKPSASAATSSVTHPPVPEPRYTVRSQPVGLSRSSSCSDVAPTISGGIARRLSVSSLSSEDEREEGNKHGPNHEPVNRPLLKHRSESLPTFPAIYSDDVKEEGRAMATSEDLANLPSNPKLWLPSHLALYLSKTLSLHPALAEDITAFIRNSRLSGRTFLRLKSTDLEELGVNVRWRAALLDEGERLRRESFEGRIHWGYEGGRQALRDQTATRSEEAATPGVSIDSSYAASFGIRNAHRRRPSLEVEGSASEDEGSKEEWKRSWRRLNRGNNHVKGLAKTFETVVETSERVTPTSSPIKNRTDSYKRSKIRAQAEEAADNTARARSDSNDSISSSASADSCLDRRTAPAREFRIGSSKPDGRHASVAMDPTFPEVEASSTHQLLSTLDKKDLPPRYAPSTATNYKWKLYPTFPDSRRAPRDSNLMSDHEASGGGSEEEEEGKTLKPVRAHSRESGSVANYASSSLTTDKRAGLADLFGLELPKATREPKETLNEEDEMIEMIVPGADDSGKGGRKSSMVLIRKSQFAALQHRMEEVESQVALALESNGFQSPKKAYSGAQSEVDELEGRLIGLEHQTRLLASISPVSSPTKDRIYHSPLCPTRSRSTVTSDDPFARDESISWWAEEASPLGWKALGGYVVAASIGIGIVAGEVVAAKLLGIRRR